MMIIIIILILRRIRPFKKRYVSMYCKYVQSLSFSETPVSILRSEYNTDRKTLSQKIYTKEQRKNQRRKTDNSNLHKSP